MGGYVMQVGGVEIVALSDMNCTHPIPLEEMWPDVPLEAWQPVRERYPDTFDGERIRLEIGCYLVRSQGQTILIDTGYGPGPIEYIGGLTGQLMADLAARDVDPEEVDKVFLSHLHLDHVGWNTIEEDGAVVPTFPNARYIAHEADLDYFRRPEVQASARYYYMHRTVEPLVDKGLLDVVKGDVDLTDEVRGFHTPGHTPGHMSVDVTSQGERVIIEGDVLIHPAQVTEETWNSRFDTDFETGTATRIKLLEQIEAENVTVVACHFPAPGYGRVVREGGRRYWSAGLEKPRRGVQP